MSTSECQVSDGRTAEPELCNQLLTFDAPDPRNLDIREQAAKVTKGEQATVQATVTPMFGFKFLFSYSDFLIISLKPRVKPLVQHAENMVGREWRWRYPCL